MMQMRASCAALLFYVEAEANVRLLVVDQMLGEIDVALGQHAASPTA